MVFRFGDFELDDMAYELRRHGRRCRLTGQPMDLLLLLVARRGQLVSRDDIARQLWNPDVFVDLDAGIHTAILRIRQALGDSRGSPAFVETVSGKGYRFVAAVQAESGPEQTAPAIEHNLPVELTTFVGRDKELTELPRRFAGARLMTLTGAGGVGKTRLAMRLARGMVGECPHGVWFVDLSPLVATEFVAPTIASMLGLRASATHSVRDVLLDTLRHRTLLIVLDTCEHLIDACAKLAETMLRHAPGLRIIATSRESLGVPGEIIYRVPSLSLPEESDPAGIAISDATRLFVERAVAIDPAFAIDATSAASVARLCRRLDGIPLAIELAAARVAVLALPQIEARLHDRFRLLTGGTRTAVPRQRTLEATIEWSYQLLSNAERLLLVRLSVFPASWPLEAAERVCSGDGIETTGVLDLLSRLVDKSLVAPERDVEHERRYRLLESVRHFARERLAQDDGVERVRDRHFRFILDEFRDAQAILRGPGQVALLRRLYVEHDNVRAALEWGLTSPSRAAAGAELAGALFWFWTKRGLFEEGERWLARAAAVPSSPRVRARALLGLAHMQDFQGRHTEAAATAVQALPLGHEAADPWAVSAALFIHALSAFQMGAHDLARAHAQEARRVAADGCAVVEQGGPLLVLANLALLDGDHDRAQQLFDESIDVHRQDGDAWGLAILLSLAAGLRTVREDFARARAQAAEALDLSEELEDPRGLAWSLEVFAGLLAARGQPEIAARIWGASDGLLERAGGSVLPTIGWIRDRYLQPACARLGEAQFTAARVAGRAMPSAQAIALARRSST